MDACRTMRTQERTTTTGTSEIQPRVEPAFLDDVKRPVCGSDLKNLHVCIPRYEQITPGLGVVNSIFLDFAWFNRESIARADWRRNLIAFIRLWTDSLQTAGCRTRPIALKLNEIKSIH